MVNDSDAPSVAHERRFWACDDPLDVDEGTFTCGLARGHEGAQHRSDDAAMYWTSFTFDLDTYEVDAGGVDGPAWRCPCRICPRCGWVNEDDDPSPHPEDGLAGPCGRCGNYEWWSVVGEFMTGDCPSSAAELERWRAYDDAVWAESERRAMGAPY